MTIPTRNARTRRASGRSLCLLLALAACQTVGGPSRPGPESAPDPVVVRAGPISQAERTEAERLWSSAQASLEARRFYEAIRTSEELVERFPSSERSGEALRLVARAELAVDSLQRADAAAQRYLDLLAPDDVRTAEMYLIQARAAPDDPARALERLMRVGPEAPGEVIGPASTETREVAASLSADELEAAVEGAVREGRVARGAPFAIAEAYLAVALLEIDRDDEAMVHARSALEAGVVGEERAWAAGVLQGELPEGRGRTTTFSIAAVLPNTGPPALADFAAQVLEGVELAVATVLGPPFQVTAVSADSEGDPAVVGELVAGLEAEGVVGIVGFLQDEVLISAADARARGVPLVSPTARTAAIAGAGVYSLEGADLEAARAVARYGASRAFQRVAMLYPANDVATAEADAFQEQAEALGISVVGRFTYDPGATFFESQIIGARDALRAAELAALERTPDDTLHMEVLEPAALFMPIPPEDVSFLAPQVLHFGLDTLRIEVLGTSGWTDEQTLRSLDARLTDGVVATAPVSAEVDSTGVAVGGFERFRRLYEERYRRTLVGTTPALGYDATLLLLEALRAGRVLPDQVRGAFEGLQDVEGATGIFSVVDGRVVRRTQVVRIQGRVPVALEGR